MLRAPLLALVCLSIVGIPARAGLGMEPSQLGFGYCSPPVVPTCIETNARHRSAPALNACSRDVLRFTQSLGAYRICLARESERAIGSGNAAIARFRCLSQGGSSCR